ANLDIDSSRQIKLHQCVYCFFGRLNDVKHPLVRSHLVLITRVFVDVRRNQHSETLFFGRKRDWPSNLSTSTLRSFHDFLRGLINQSIVECFQPDTNLLALHGNELQLSSRRFKPLKKEPNCKQGLYSCQPEYKKGGQSPLLLGGSDLRLCDDLSHNACTHGPAAFANR